MGNCISCAMVIPVPNVLLPKRVSFKKEDIPTVEVSLEEPQEPQEEESEVEFEEDEPVQVSWYETFNMCNIFWSLEMFIIYLYIIVLANIIARFYKLD
jgi:hypothetical protein